MMKHTLLVFFLILFACHSGPSGLSPLVLAARSGDTAAIKLLVARGADPNLADTAANGWTPMEHAIHKHQVAAVTALLDAGANVNATSRNGTTALMMAAGYGYTDVVELLLARGADRTLKNAKGETALDLAKSGVTDIDRFTYFDKQTSTVKALTK